MECRPFVAPDGTLRLPSKSSASHYHLKMECLSSACVSFDPRDVVTPPDVSKRLTPQHFAILFALVKSWPLSCDCQMLAITECMIDSCTIGYCVCVLCYVCYSLMEFILMYCYLCDVCELRDVTFWWSFVLLAICDASYVMLGFCTCSDVSFTFVT